MSEAIGEALWFCACTPVEILEAAGLRPVRCFGDDVDDGEAEKSLSRYTCPMAMAYLMEGMKKENAIAAIFVDSCAAMRHLHRLWRERRDDDFTYLIDFPMKVGPTGLRRANDSLHRLCRRLEAFLGREITYEALLGAVEGRAAVKREYFLAAREVSGLERMALSRRAQRTTSAEYLECPPRKTTTGYGVPLLLTGEVRDVGSMIGLIEGCGGWVVGMDLCNGDRPLAELDKPEGGNREEILLSMARHYLVKRNCVRIHDIRALSMRLLNMMRVQSARGVILAGISYCDALPRDYAQLATLMEHMGIPLLMLERDTWYIDARWDCARIETFVKSLRRGGTVHAGDR